jgi:hypothetical protein
MGGQAAAAPDAPVVDTAEKVHISSLALLKMLKHGKLPPEDGCRTALVESMEQVCPMSSTKQAPALYMQHHRQE